MRIRNYTAILFVNGKTWLPLVKYNGVCIGQTSRDTEMNTIYQNPILKSQEVNTVLTRVQYCTYQSSILYLYQSSILYLPEFNIVLTRVQYCTYQSSILYLPEFNIVLNRVQYCTYQRLICMTVHAKRVTLFAWTVTYTCQIPSFSNKRSLG